MENSNEVEVKIPLADRASAEARLKQAGFQVSVPRQWESNNLYDTHDQALRQKHMLLRLRQSGDRAVLTWKGPGQAGPHKSRPELETSIGSFDTVRQIFEHLGLSEAFRYEKYRTEYTRDHEDGLVTVDQTPIGDFLEIEGPADWIDSTASELGFSRDHYVLDSYGALYLKYCKDHSLEPHHMVFASHPENVDAVALTPALSSLNIAAP